ncbi:uncharacterized protein C20orf96 homolog isoform X2 [Protopterus annectens]|uniref:uncharacterized protein C20orf96 homolog isoform X2 n=1 Tax=Protopterus annectens TaxID=7888 RepID=UPI001CF968BA|nr:uncharacterized protein C20orf96 homolog isoform X2 [Protopterus annectens]
MYKSVLGDGSMDCRTPEASGKQDCRQDCRQWETASQKEKRLSALPSILKKLDNSSIPSGRTEQGASPVFSVHWKTGEKSTVLCHPSTACSIYTVISSKKKFPIIKVNPVKKQENIHLFKYMIRSKRQAIAACEKQITLLMNVNGKLMQEIKEMDSSALKNARNLLEQYGKYGKAICKVSNWGQHQTDEAKNELQNTQTMVEKELKVLEKQLMEINTKVDKAKEEAHSLRVYKDTEYPIKALRISELQRETLKLNEMQQDEQEDVEQLVQAEMKKQIDIFQLKEADMLDQIVNEIMNFFPPGLKEMSFQNAVMKKEIEIHQKTTVELEKRNAELQGKVSSLTRMIKETRRAAFCDVLQEQSKCSPDMDVILNIPVEEWLPI